MDRLTSMQVFTRVVERRSFTRAAEDLDLPRSTISDAIRALEARLGVRLLQRTTRHVSPTLDGAAYYQRCLSILAEIEDAESAFTSAHPAGHLRVEVHGTLARHVILPALPAFLAAYPDIDIHMSEGDRWADPVREGLDCVVRVGNLPDSGMVARRLTLLDEVTLAAPAYLVRHGRPSHPDDLAGGHRMVGFHSTATGALLPLEFSVDGQLRQITLPSSFSVTAAESYVAAALLGLGLIQVPHYHVEAMLNAGTLEQVLPAFPPSPSPVFLLYPQNRQLSPRFRVFRDWVVGLFEVMPRTGPASPSPSSSLAPTPGSL